MDLTTIKLNYIWLSVFYFILFTCHGTYSDVGKMSSLNLQNHFSSSTGSHFTTKNNTRVVAQKGGMAILPCAVKLNSPATISWIRRRDFQLLTVGLSTYSSDERFLIEHTRHMGHWSLRIKSVREEDRGLYECQLSVHPTQSIFVELKVVEAVAEVTSAPDLHIHEGSKLRLECKLKHATENPVYVFWYHNDKMVNYDTQDGFSVIAPNYTPINYNYNHDHEIMPNLTENLIPSTAHYATAPQQFHLLSLPVSVLTIEEVHSHHAGNYTCTPSNARPASINVHVIRAEKPAAMQHANRSTIDGGGSSSSSSSSSSSCSSTNKSLRLLTLILLIFMYHKINR